MVFFAARSTGNNGEFFDVITGSPTLDLVALLLIWFVVSALPVLAAYALLAVLFHLIRRR